MKNYNVKVMDESFEVGLEKVWQRGGHFGFKVVVEGQEYEIEVGKK